MSQKDQLASHIYHLFLGRNPNEKERSDLSSLGLGHDGYLWHDERTLQNFDQNKPILLMYTSCHAEQFMAYLRAHRPEIIQEHYVFVLFTHRLLLHRGSFNIDLIHAIFNRADLLITNPMNVKFEELSTIPLLPHRKTGCKTVTFVPPSVAAFWPVAEYFGEEPVADAMLQGVLVDETVQRFLDGKLECLFDYRYKSQMERLKLRERDCNVGISAFIDANLKAHKLFFTSNHPTFHLVAYMMEEMLGYLGFFPKPDAWQQVPTNGADFHNHFPETAYEWNHFGFQYPRRWEKEWGGPNKFYPDVIRKAYARITDPQQVLRNPATPVELEP